MLAMYAFARNIRMTQRHCRAFLICNKARQETMHRLYDKMVVLEHKRRRARAKALASRNADDPAKKARKPPTGPSRRTAETHEDGTRITKAERDKQLKEQQAAAAVLARNAGFADLNTKYTKTHQKASKLLREAQQKEQERIRRASLMEGSAFDVVNADGTTAAGQNAIKNPQSSKATAVIDKKEEKRAKMRFIHAFLKEQRKLHIDSASEEYKKRCNDVLSQQTTRFDADQIRAMFSEEATVGDFMQLDTSVLLDAIPRNPPFMVLERCLQGHPSCATFQLQVERQVDRQAQAKLLRLEANHAAAQASEAAGATATRKR